MSHERVQFVSTFLVICAILPGTLNAGGWHALRDEGRGWAHVRLSTPIAALWACHPARVSGLRVRP